MLNIPASSDPSETTWTSTSYDLNGTNGYESIHEPSGNAFNLFDPSNCAPLPPDNQASSGTEDVDPTFDYDTEHYSSFDCALQSDIDAEISGHGEEPVEFDKLAPGSEDAPGESEICLGLVSIPSLTRCSND